MKENRPCFYTAKMIDGTWLDYLEKINNSAKEMLDRFIRELVAKQGITEVLKSQ
ncbi:MAG: TnpV protein [Clostridiales bacterium]|nr:MAG: TnpV protein [Clostridiales bacterium]